MQKIQIIELGSINGVAEYRARRIQTLRLSDYIGYPSLDARKRSIREIRVTVPGYVCKSQPLPNEQLPILRVYASNNSTSSTGTHTLLLNPTGVYSDGPSEFEVTFVQETSGYGVGDVELSFELDFANTAHNTLPASLINKESLWYTSLTASVKVEIL